MPNIVRSELYNATLAAAKEIFARAGALDPFSMTRDKGTSLYRYVSYRKLKPQDEEAARKIWTPLAKDTGNRWTGLSADERGGSQGLYMSGEFIDEDHPFPELEYYQASTEASTQEIEYMRYEAGSAPVKVSVSASELRTLFLFTQTRALNGIDFSLKINGDYHPLLAEILELVKQNDSVLKKPVLLVEDSLRSLYISHHDASFTRAIGNALFEVDKDKIDFFQVTSARDERSPNIILRAHDTPINYLQAEGRATFLVNLKGKRGIGVYTNDDLAYNSKFEIIDKAVM